MMEGLGKEGSEFSPTNSPWLSHPKTEGLTPLWNLKDSPVPSQANKRENDMDSRNTALELKDVPPPPLHHTLSSQPSQLFSLAPHSLPPPCLLATHLTQDPHQQQLLPQAGASPKVSSSAHCDYCITEGHVFSNGGVVAGSSIAGVVSHYVAPDSLATPNYSSSIIGTCGPCSVVSTVDQYKHSCGCVPGYDVYDPLFSCGYKPQRPSSIATSQPVSAQSHRPCCSGLCHTYPAETLSCNQPRLFPSSACLAPSVPPVSALPASLHGSHLASPGYYICGVDCSPIVKRTQRSAALFEHTTTASTSTAISTTATSAHLCSNPMHLNVSRTVCVKGLHSCQECLLKPMNGLVSESEKAWPSIPVLQPAPVSIPICNGCGTSSDSLALNLGKTFQKFGFPESGSSENIPPVGVFWDIENCSVPSGRSAGVVVQRIRSRFFQGHREAEFICVCDISKESKAVIQELNNCQVTVAHINATAKNAADDKLRQGLRRFAETHTAPATVVLVSSDVNFASELSDLRHRHGFQVILIHGNHTSQALLQHAHCHVAFQEITADLPPSILIKTQSRLSRRSRRATRQCYTPGAVPERPYSPKRGCSGPPGGAPAKPHQELDNTEGKPKSGFHPNSPSHRNGELETLEQLPKPGFSGESFYRRRKDCSNPRSGTESPVEQGGRGSVEFQISTPSAFSKLNLHRSFSPFVSPQSSWSSRTASPCLSSRSSPLRAPPRSPIEGAPEPFSEGAEIQVANLDYRMSRKELQQTLRDTFSRYGRVKTVELSPHTDYQLKATIQMLSLQQAISAVSRLHRYKVGSKRIQVSLVTGGHNKSLAMLSSEIINILQDAPASCLPLFKFIDIYEKKYSRKLVISDLYRLPEVVAVREQGGSRLVCLLPSSQVRRSPLGSSQSQEGSSIASGSPVVFEDLEYHEPVCRQHYTELAFSEADFDPDSYRIPFVVMSLSTLSSEVHTLLQSHDGTLPLLSFPDCYEAKFSQLQLGNETLEGGVPLEHLITCVPSITIVTAQNGFKIIKWIHNKPPAPNSEPWLQRCKSPVGNPQLIQLSREIIDLLKSQPSCIIPIHKFIPFYHHHFAKQCRVSDYGYSKLLELLEAVPHVLQILGMGTKRLLTLTHRAQVKRFTQDLLKLLKFQASKQVAFRDFMQAYHWCFSRDWSVTDYGTCNLPDLLTEIPDTTITVTHLDTDTVISVPKRERTTDEMERAKQFGKEVVDLLRHQPHCRMLFSKFIPTYHHHFGRQCKLSYYGFTKLMELFEAIPEVLMVLECSEEKVLTLTEVERVKALAAQLVKILRAQKNSSLPVNQLLTEYTKTFGYSLRLQDYDVCSLPALLSKLCHVVMVVDGTEGREVQLINRKSLRFLTSQLLALLMSQEERIDRGVKVDVLSLHYQTVHGAPLNPCEYGFLSLSELLKSLPYLVELYREECDGIEASDTISGLGEEWVRLTRLYQFARNVRALLHTYHYNQIFMSEFQGAYRKFTGCNLGPRYYGYTSTDELLSAIPQVVWIKGHGHKRIIVLKNDMKVRATASVSSSPLPGENMESPRESPTNTLEDQSPRADLALQSELQYQTFPIDLLCGPVPSSLPSPQLHPDSVLLQQVDLIRFEEKTSEGVETNMAADGSAVDDTKTTVDSPSRRGPRNRIKLAANFAFKSGF
ncbi:meiosis regulator and mRNA stability factor 1 isoform X2 [Nerophis lumbriciformis]|uniref:meiosis regulator and mRNA stability factor 1 isoform X2 n=1 Tax=Nerophis lumbriciformis TaxID=546530 RepID=UPI002AE02B38|nr:meiosis regulator and mRNA stability factor 1-like isoform X2 [Nerophis lumbriciformis]